MARTASAVRAAGSAPRKRPAASKGGAASASASGGKKAPKASAAAARAAAASLSASAPARGEEDTGARHRRKSRKRTAHSQMAKYRAARDMRARDILLPARVHRLRQHAMAKLGGKIHVSGCGEYVLQTLLHVLLMDTMQEAVVDMNVQGRRTLGAEHIVRGFAIRHGRAFPEQSDLSHVFAPKLLDAYSGVRVDQIQNSVVTKFSGHAEYDVGTMKTTFGSEARVRLGERRVTQGHIDYLQSTLEPDDAGYPYPMGAMYVRYGRIRSSNPAVAAELLEKEVKRRAAEAEDGVDED